MRDKDGLEPAARGAPLVATWPRWSAATALLGVAVILAVEAYLVFAHAGRTLESFASMIAVTCTLGAAWLWAMLRAEELRLARELRTARTGTSTLRAMVAPRRQQGPALWRLLSTKLGTAAVLLADGDRQGALYALARSSPLMRGGRLEKLSAVVDADVERAVGTPVSLDRCVERLRLMPRIGNREADLYRTHVLVRALLERGDAESALALAGELETSRDDEERVYLAWLCTWFDFDAAAEHVGPGPDLSEGQLRMATLLARAHGADKLVEKLEGRVAAIARPLQGQ
jgi:hypothetical protein